MQFYFLNDSAEKALPSYVRSSLGNPAFGSKAGFLHDRLRKGPDQHLRDWFCYCFLIYLPTMLSTEP